jgi:hypothetical protein
MHFLPAVSPAGKTVKELKEKVFNEMIEEYCRGKR